MKKQGNVTVKMPKKIKLVNPNPNVSALQITDIKEFDEGWRLWFYFNVNNDRYYIIITGDPQGQYSNESQIIAVKHKTNHCSFCGPGIEEDDDCVVLSENSEELFKKIIPQSKNRLRWITKVIV